MKLASAFSVPAAPDRVLALFLDPATMQACIPGCEELVQRDDTHYQGTLVNEVAHVRFKAGFTAEITSRTTPSNAAEPVVVTAVLKGEDRRLGSTIRVDATLTVAPEERDDAGDVSQVGYEFELAMWGKLGRLGESVIRRRTMEVEKQFAEALTAICAGEPLPAAPPLKQRRTASGRPTPKDAVATPGERSTPEGEPPSVAGPAAAVPAATDRPREDLVILGLAVAAAFAYGVILGGRRAVAP